MLRPILSVSLWVLIVIVIVAIVLWIIGIGLIAIVLWTLIGIYAIAWILSIVLTRVAASLGQELAKRGQEITQAIAKVVNEISRIPVAATCRFLSATLTPRSRCP